MNRSGSIFWTVIAMVSLGGCESVYPNQANLQVVQGIQVELSKADRHAALISRAALEAPTLVRIADDSMEDARNAVKPLDVMRSKLLGAEASLLLANAPITANIQGWLLAQGANSVWEYSERLGNQAAELCADDTMLEADAKRDCSKARLYRDTARIELLASSLTEIAAPDAPAEETWVKANGLVEQIGAHISQSWMEGPAIAEVSEQRLRKAYFTPLLCNLEMDVTSLIQTAVPEDLVDIKRTFNANGRQAIASGAAVISDLEDNASEQPVCNGSPTCAYEAVRKTCNLWRGLQVPAAG